ncbi:type II secretion system F family protein [Streptomyces sp. ZYX-F-203]
MPSELTGALPVGAAFGCAAGVVTLVRDRSSAARRVRGLLDPSGVYRAGRPTAHRTVGALRGTGVVVRPEWWALCAGVMLALLTLSAVPLVVGVVAVPVLRRSLAAARVRRDRERRRLAVIDLCAALAGEVRAGRQPTEALVWAVGRSDATVVDGGGVVAAARFGGDVPAALQAAAREPGAEGLLGLAACWQVAVGQGAGLADGLDRLEAALRAERDQRIDLVSRSAGARATAVLLAGLPALGLLIGFALGADPLRVLLHTGPGLACLAAGGILEAVGLWWVARIVRGAEGPS